MSNTRSSFKSDGSSPVVIDADVQREAVENHSVYRARFGPCSVDISPLGNGERWMIHSRSVTAEQLHGLSALRMVKRGAE